MLYNPRCGAANGFKMPVVFRNAFGKNQHDSVFFEYFRAARYTLIIPFNFSLFFRSPVNGNPMQIVQQEAEERVIEHVAPDGEVYGLFTQARNDGGIEH